MENKIYDDGFLAIFNRGWRFFLRYDAGSHQIAMREDEISEAEANLIMQGQDEATKVLFAVQDRLAKAGIDPYESNIN